MTTMTIAPALTGGHDPAFYAGRADAYDDHHAGTSLATLIVRLSYLIDDHPVTQYAAGYAARVWEIDREQAAMAAAETTTAFQQAASPRLRGRALLDAKTVADAEAAHCRRLGISLDAYRNATS